MEPALIALPERIYRVCRGTDPLHLNSWEYIRQSSRGRWDDTEDEYRVLYCSSTQVGAFVETLQDLRQNEQALEALSEIAGDDEPLIEMATVVRDRLRNRWIATLIPSHPDELVVHVAHGATRTFIEQRLENELSQRGITALKIGDAIDAHCNGVRAPSAEHDGSETLAVFETHSVSGRLRVSLIPSSVQLTLERADVALEAARFLGMVATNT